MSEPIIQYGEPIPIGPLLEQVRGSVVEHNLISLARFGGIKTNPIPEQSERYAVSRLALSPQEFEARKHLRAEMEKAGMIVTETPLGLVGDYAGVNTDSGLQPVLMLSHFDSVPDAGMYDGTVGVTSAIEVVNILNQNSVRLPHPIRVLALTGEESSRFNMALFGSRGLFHGLRDDELDLHRTDDLSIRQAIDQAGFSSDSVKAPQFRQGDFLAAVELHVSQDERLNASNHDLAVIEAIAAPVRSKITIGNQLQSEKQLGSNSRYLTIDVAGKAGHSGATPMGKESRADGLVPLSEILIHANAIQNTLDKADKKVQISGGGISIEGQALNKIPGKTHMSLRVSGDDQEAIQRAITDINEFISRRNNDMVRSPTQFNRDSMPIQTEEKKSDSNLFYNSQEVLRHHSLAAYIIKAINSISTVHRGENNVGTVGTYNVKDGQIELGVDIRGIDKYLRDQMVVQIEQVISTVSRSPIVTGEENIPCRLIRLPGSGDPVRLDNRLVALAEQAIEDNNIGTHVVTHSAAGHDAMNVAQANIPTVMMFIPSRPNTEGEVVSHRPDEYSTPQDLENGTKALFAFVYKLASIKTNDLSEQ